jgi:hypothetical protein
MEKLNWKKVKSSGTFRRNVKRNLSQILHSVPSVSNSQLITGNDDITNKSVVCNDDDDVEE